jgi:DNA-binding MarR family transcriptional regulator
MTAKNFRDEHALKGAFLSNLLLRLVDLIANQGDDLLRKAEITIPARAVACVLFIGDKGETSLADIAKGLDESHQLAAHRVEGLIELDLIERSDDPRDRRRKILSLTPKGRTQYKRLCARLAEIEAALSGLYEEIGIHIPTIIEQAVESLHRTPLLDRIHANPTRANT